MLLGPRQVGKATLALSVAAAHPGAIVLDLEREGDRAAIAQPDLFFPRHRDGLVVLDEVRHAPALFQALRPEIDTHRQPGRFLLLGSASGELLRQSGESLAGRVACLELTPLLACELAVDLQMLQTLWLRGGYPLSFLVAEDSGAFQWRQDFLRSFLQRDLPGMGLRVPAETLRRFWTMLAHLQGQLFNASQLGVALGGASHTTTACYLDTLVDTMMVRRLGPHLANVGKRLVKSPKVYVRDSGLLHALPGLADVRDLQGHPVAGASWEGFDVEQVPARGRADGLLPRRRRRGDRPRRRLRHTQAGHRDQVLGGAEAGPRVLAVAAGPGHPACGRRGAGAAGISAGRGGGGPARGGCARMAGGHGELRAAMTGQLEERIGAVLRVARRGTAVEPPLARRPIGSSGTGRAGCASRSSLPPSQCHRCGTRRLRRRAWACRCDRQVCWPWWWM